MSAYNTLEPTLREILRVIIPLEEDYSVRCQIINELQAVVDSLESLGGATVEPYGSFVSDLFSRWGDLDISIEIPNGSYILSAARKHKQTCLEDLQKVLRNRDGWRRLRFISNARISSLKCENSYANISCDISFNYLSGHMKSKMLFWLKEIDGRFRQMALLVKEWAKAHDINGPKNGSFNSYCLTLLVIFHLQTCIPAILPPLGEIYPGNMVDDLRGVRSVAERRIEEICTENISKFNRLKERNPIPLCDLFVSFLEKFSNISSWAPTQGICLYTGQWENIDNNMTWQPKTYSLFVEDPFEQPANTARTVRSKQLVEISEAFKMTLRKLNTRNQVPGSIIPFLVTPQTSQFLPRMMFYDPSLDYNNRAQPQMNRPNWGHSPGKQQTQNSNKSQVYDPSLEYNNRTQPEMKRENRGRWQAKGQTQNGEKDQVDELAPNKADTQRPAQVSQKQEQQVWRPRSNGLPKMNRANSGLWQPKRPSQNGEKAQDDERALTKANIQRPAQVSKNQEQQVWRPISNGNKDESN